MGFLSTSKHFQHTKFEFYEIIDIFSIQEMFQKKLFDAKLLMEKENAA